MEKIVDLQLFSNHDGIEGLVIRVWLFLCFGSLIDFLMNSLVVRKHQKTNLNGYLF